MRFDALAIGRELPDTARAREFGGEAMVQSFIVPLPGGRSGRAWIRTAEALRVPAFGRAWVGARLTALGDELGEPTLIGLLAAGLRLRSAAEPAPRATLELARAA